MKPYDGGAWVGVSRVRNSDALHQAYDESGERLMHLQASVEGYDAFARSLSIGAETMVMRFRPELPMHDRYAVQHEFLAAGGRRRGDHDLQLVNAFFRWEFNSCELLVRGAEVHPIDYANACPDVAITSLHYYFPWAMSALAALDGVLLRHRPDAAAGPGHPGYFAVADRDAVVRGQARPSTGSWPTTTSRPSATATSAPPGCRTWTRSSATGCARTEFDELLVRHRPRHLPGRRARPVHRPLPRPDQQLDSGPAARLRAVSGPARPDRMTHCAARHAVG